MIAHSLPGYDAWLTAPLEDSDKVACPTCDGLGVTCGWCYKPSWAKLGLDGPADDTCTCRIHDGSNLLSQLELLGYATEWADRWAPCTECNGEGSVEPDPTSRYSDYPYI